MNVAVAGGASFIASHLIDKLKSEVKYVWAIDDLSSGKKNNIPDIELREGDLRDYKFTKKALKGADVVFDLSSYHGGRGVSNSSHDVELTNNFILNTNVLRAAVDVGAKEYYFSSSACAYDIRKQMDYDEDFKIPETWDLHHSPMYPDGMYGLSKLTHEKTTAAYFRNNLIGGNIFRFFVVMGERMRESHFICASIAKSFIKQDPFYVWGTGKEIRNFTHVDDIVNGMLTVMDKGANGEIYNIGIERRITINEALETIWKTMEWRPKEIIYQPDKPVGVVNRVADASKIKALGWEQKVSFENAIQRTVEWYVKNHTENEVRANLEYRMYNR